MLRNSELIGRTGETCAEARDLCARECGCFVDDLGVRACGRARRRCATSCRNMADLQRNRTPQK